MSDRLLSEMRMAALRPWPNQCLELKRHHTSRVVNPVALLIRYPDMNSIVFAPPFQYGGVKSLYSVCQLLKDVGRSTIRPFGAPTLATWFGHDCELYDYSYSPDVLIYPEVYQPHVSGARYHICLALGKRGMVEPYADLTVCRSREILDWVKKQRPQMPAVLILPSIDRSVFEYDGRPKKDTICYMTRPDK